jgi:hypothetical protein
LSMVSRVSPPGWTLCLRARQARERSVTSRRPSLTSPPGTGSLPFLLR